MIFVAICAVTTLLAFYGVEQVRSWVLSRGVLDTPNARSSHTVPTPTSGGVALVVATGLGGLAVHEFLEPVPGPYAALYGAGCVVALLGLLDDFYKLSALLRLLAHLGLALGFTWYVGPLTDVQIASWQVGPGPLAWPVTVLWLVGLTNLYNFMDGIDGIAGTMGVVVAVGFVVLLTGAGAVAPSVLVAVLGASILGFLVHNFPPARIFLGDVGSGFLGFVFAGLAVLGHHEGAPFPAFVLVLSPFIFDASVTLLRRALAGERWYTAHRSHFYQRLTIIGWAHRDVLRVEIPIMLACGGAAIFYADASPNTQWFVLGGVLALHAGFALYVTMLEKEHTKDATSE